MAELKGYPFQERIRYLKEQDEKKPVTPKEQKTVDDMLKSAGKGFGVGTPSYKGTKKKKVKGNG